MELRSHEELTDGHQRLVTDRELSILAPRLGKDWRSFMRTELVINHWQIEDVENNSSLPVNEKIYKLLRMWKNKRKHKCTVSLLVEHLDNFQYSVDTWDFLLTELSETEESLSNSPSGADPNSCTSEAAPLDLRIPIASFGQGRREEMRESPYDKAHKGGSPGQKPKFRFVVQLMEEMKIALGFEEDLHFEEGTKLDVVIQYATSYLARDIEGHLLHVSRSKCRKAGVFCPPVLSENVWFHEKVERTQIEELFEGKEVSTFLIRHASEPGNFALSVKGYNGPLHFKILSTPTGYTVSEDHYHSFTELICAYNGVAIYSTPDGKVFLRHPLPKD